MVVCITRVAKSRTIKPREHGVEDTQSGHAPALPYRFPKEDGKTASYSTIMAWEVAKAEKDKVFDGRRRWSEGYEDEEEQGGGG